MRYHHIKICCNAGKGVGWGHLTRCLSLAEGFKENGINEIVFFFYSDHEEDFKRIEKQGYRIIRTKSCSDVDYIHFLKSYLGRDKENTLWVFDSYFFESQFYEKVSEYTDQVMIIDDISLPRGKCKYFLNHNFGFEEPPKNLDPSVIYMGGVHFFLLNTEIIPYIKIKDITRDSEPNPLKILVTFGGIDSKNQTLKVVQALNAVSEKLQINVIIGNSHPEPDSIYQEVQKSHTLHEYKILKPQASMISLLADSDCIFTAIGITCYEALALNVHQFNIAVNEEQYAIAKSFPNNLKVHFLGFHEKVLKEDIARAFDMKKNHFQKKSYFDSPKFINGRGNIEVVNKVLK